MRLQAGARPGAAPGPRQPQAQAGAGPGSAQAACAGAGAGAPPILSSCSRDSGCSMLPSAQKLAASERAEMVSSAPGGGLRGEAGQGAAAGGTCARSHVGQCAGQPWACGPARPRAARPGAHPAAALAGFSARASFRRMRSISPSNRCTSTCARGGGGGSRGRQGKRLAAAAAGLSRADRCAQHSCGNSETAALCVAGTAAAGTSAAAAAAASAKPHRQHAAGVQLRAQVQHLGVRQQA